MTIRRFDAPEGMPTWDELQNPPKILPGDLWNMGAASLGESYQEQALESDKITIKLGYPKLDKAMRGVKPGEVLIVIARTKVGKSAFGSNMLGQMSGKGMPTLCFSLEMPRQQQYERFVQMEQDMSGEEVERLFKTKNDMAERVKRDMGDKLPCIWIVDRPGLTIREMTDATLMAEEETAHKFKCVLIDYLGLVKPEHSVSDSYERTSVNALQLRDLAKETDTAVICLHQVNREGGDGSEPLTMNMARDSGVVEESCDFMIGMWKMKPGVVNAEDYRNYGLLANRRGPEIRGLLSFSRKTLKIREIEPGEQLKKKITTDLEKFYAGQGGQSG